MIDRRDQTGVEELDRSDIQVVEPGTKLEPGGVYLDLYDPDRGPFKALAGQEAGTGNRYVARRDVDQVVWNHLVEHLSTDDTESSIDE